MFRAAPATLEAHPLLRRLSGQAIWGLFEDAGAEPVDIDAFLVWWERQRDAALAALERLLSPGPDAAALRVRVDHNGPGPACAACAACARLDGLVVPAGHPRLGALFPPYGLGCPARAEVLEAGHADLARALALDDPGPEAHGRLVCGPWVFSRRWSRP